MKDKLNLFFKKIEPYFEKLNQNKYLQAVTGAMMATLGPMILGSFATLFGVYAGRWHLFAFAQMMTTVNSVTIGAVSLYVVFLIAKHLANLFLKNDDGSSAGIIALMSFLIMTPLLTKNRSSFIPTTWLGASGLFSAIIIGLIVGRLYVYMKVHNWTIKMPNGVPPMVSETFAALIPALLMGVLFVLISLLFANTPFHSFHQAIYTLIQMPLRSIGGSIWAMILVALLMQLVWFFGIHGTNVFMPIVMPIWMSMDMQNLQAFQAGKPLPNITGYAFFNVVTWSGTGLGLILLMTLFAKSKRYKTLGKVAIIPGLFGITEPVIFGTPLVLNFDFFIPFVTNDAIMVALAYILTKLGILARFSGAQMVFGLPIGFSAASCGGSWTIILFQLIMQLIIAPLLWYPWFRHADKKALREEQAK